MQDRDAGEPVLKASRALLPFVTKLFADSAYNHDRVKDATGITVKIVAKITGQTGFVMLPRRWGVERFFAWINRNRRLAKDVEATIKSARAFLTLHPSCCSSDASHSLNPCFERPANFLKNRHC